MPNLVFLFSLYCFRVRTSHPGAVIALCDNPLDANKVINRSRVKRDSPSYKSTSYIWRFLINWLSLSLSLPSHSLFIFLCSLSVAYCIWVWAACVVGSESEMRWNTMAGSRGQVFGLALRGQILCIIAHRWLDLLVAHQAAAKAPVPSLSAW